MHDIVIANGRVIDPAGGRDEVCDVAIDGECIAAVGTPRGKARQTIDAKGKIVCPGLIDLHVHCREPGHEEEETIATASAAAAAGGFATICAMPNTHPPADDERAVQYVIQRAAEAAQARVLPVGCITKARAGEELAEMGAMLEAGAVGFSDDGDGVASTAVMQRALQYAARLGAPLMQHCQDPDLMGGGQMNSGTTAVRLGLGGIAASGEQIMLRRDLKLVEHTGARYHVQHVSTVGSVELIRQAKQAGLAVTAEATPHHLLLTDAACSGYDPNYKVNPPLRSAADVEALRAGVADGTIDCLASDHAPHAKEEKDLEFGLAPFGIASLECALGLYAKALIDSGWMDWPGLIARLTTGPAAVLVRPGTDAGAATPQGLAAGAPADVTLIDPGKRWTVRPAKFLSKGRNCPYDGWRLKGRATATLVGGRTILCNLPASTMI
ncbi:MAG: dihydroorotase [Phycisphaerae bacterium]|nr:dihydroorotase [Phycisphaerae bacterium]